MARATYAHRRSAVVGELSRLGVVTGGRDGLNLWLPVRDETAAVLFLASRGIGVATGGPFMSRTTEVPHLRVTVGMVADNFSGIASELANASEVSASFGPR